MPIQPEDYYRDSIRKLMHLNNLTPYKLVRLSGYTGIDKWLRGDMSVSIYNLNRLYEVFGRLDV